MLWIKGGTCTEGTCPLRRLHPLERPDGIDERRRHGHRLRLVQDQPVGTDQLDRALEAIAGAARTGRIGDGKIFVSEVLDVMRIRTGETGAIAI